MTKNDMIPKVLQYLFVVLLCYGCANSGYKISLTDSLESSVSNDTLYWYQIDIGHEWDSVYIVKPYAVVSEIDAELTETDRVAIEKLTQFDIVCTLLFIKDNRLVAYSSVPRDVIDFCQVKETKFARNSVCHPLCPVRKIKI